MVPYGYRLSRAISKYHKYSNDVKVINDFEKYLKSKLGKEYYNVMKYALKDYRVKLTDVQSVDVNSVDFSGMLLVGDRGCGKDYTACGAILEFIHNNPNSFVAVFDANLEHKRGNDGEYTSWILKVLYSLLPPFLNFTLDENSGRLLFNNGAVLELHHVTDDLGSYTESPIFDFIVLNESSDQKGISLEILPKISKSGWVAVGTYQDPIGDTFVSDCMSSGVDVRFSSYKDNPYLSKAYTDGIGDIFGVFGRVITNEECISKEVI